MFINKILQQNLPLARFGLDAVSSGSVLPDSYIIDTDALYENAERIIAKAKERGLRAYFMLKQVGRNPVIAERLCKMGYDGAVAVDFREALSYAKKGIKLGNVGHLVQLPEHSIPEIIGARPQIVTVYSVEKAASVGRAAKESGFSQDIMLRVTGENDPVFSGQEAGFSLSELAVVSDTISKIPGVSIAGVCSFPCFLINSASGQIEPTPSAETVRAAAELLRGLGHNIKQLNMPSANCLGSIDAAAAAGATHIEPGHALLGTTPYNALPGVSDEKPAIIYMSEVSHNVGNRGFCYGGGYYRRGHLESAVVGSNLDNPRILKVIPPDDDSIDYHFGLSEASAVGAPVLMSFRTQIFVTRSRVVLVEGLSRGTPRIAGVYDALGERSLF